MALDLDLMGLVGSGWMALDLDLIVMGGGVGRMVLDLDLIVMDVQRC